MARKKRLSASKQDELFEQTSVLLQLAPELRNMIYDAVVHNAEHINYCRDHVFTHPLAQTCRQLRHEFYDMWATERRRYARNIHLHCRDFDAKQLAVPYECATEDPNPISLHIHLTTFWDVYLSRLRRMVSGFDTLDDLVVVVVHFEQPDFDVDQCRRILAGLQWCYKNYLNVTKERFEKLHAAIEMAIEVRESEMSKSKSIQSRKRRGMLHAPGVRPARKRVRARK